MKHAFVVCFSSESVSGENFMGKAEHVQSGEAIHFTTLQEFLYFVSNSLRDQAQLDGGFSTIQETTNPKRENCN
jgi:hypothetical protein